MATFRDIFKFRHNGTLFQGDVANANKAVIKEKLNLAETINNFNVHSKNPDNYKELEQDTRDLFNLAKSGHEPQAMNFAVELTKMLPAYSHQPIGPEFVSKMERISAYQLRTINPNQLNNWARSMENQVQADLSSESLPTPSPVRIDSSS